MHNLFFLILCFWCFNASNLVAQGYQTQFHDLSMEKGLSNPAILTAFEDNSGFVWFGTGYGLNRYDGYNYEVFTAEKDGLSSNNVEQIAQDANGMLWLGYPTSFGTITGMKAIDVFDPISHLVQPVEDYFPHELWKDYHKIHQILSDTSGCIWVLLKDGKLFKQKNKDFVLVFQYNYDFHGEINKISEDGLWLCNMERGELERYHIVFIDFDGHVLFEQQHAPFNIRDSWSSEKAIFSSPKDYQVPNVLYLKQGNTIIKAPTYNLLGNKTYMHYAFSPSGEHIWAWGEAIKIDSIFVFDLNGNLEQRIAYQIEGQVERIAPMVSYATNLNACGLRWASLPGEGQAFGMTIAPLLFRTMLSKGKDWLDRKESSHQGRSLLELDNGVIAVVNQQSYQFNPKDKTLQFWKDFPATANFAACVDRKDQFWLSVGHLNGVLMKKNSDSAWKLIGSNTRLKAVWHIYEAQSGVLWIAHQEGISYVANQQDTILAVDEDNSLLKSHNYFLLERPEGFWLASESGLILLDLNSKKVQRHYHTKGEKGRIIPHNHIVHIRIDDEGVFWLASKGGGLIRLEPETGKVKQFTTAEGLSHNILYAVYEDQHDGLWLSSNYGIMRFDKNTFTVNEYHLRDGISHEEFNTVSHLQAKNGTIYFGGLNGYTYFHPEDFYKNQLTTKTPFQISKFIRRNRETGATVDETASLLQENQVVLTGANEEFTLHFSLLNYIATENNRYAYMIKGLDNNWNYISRPEIQFSNLPYGEFELLIKAQGRNGIWQAYSNPIVLQVPKPFYLQVWFITLVITIISVIVYLSVRWRIVQLENRKLELEEEVANRTQKISQQAEELKGLDKAKNLFFANISHELRTPLTLIISPTESLLYQPDNTWVPQRIRPILQTAYQNGKHLLRLVEEILDLTKLDAQQLELKPELLLIKDFVETIATAFRAQASEKGIDFLVLGTDAVSDLVVALDYHKTEKILYNLLSNAFKFTPTAGVVELKVEVDKQFLAFIVRDTGRGIPAEDLPHIFERFFQSNQQEQRTSNGTGIGLAFTKALVELMEGRVEVQSTLGKGSCFNVKLPLITGVLDVTETLTREEEAEIAATERPLIGNFSIAIAEDHHDLRQFLVQLLSPQFETIAFENGRLLHDYLFQESRPKVDLIISDLMMPEMDGLELLSTINKDEYWSTIPSIMLTARAGQHDKLEAYTIGVNDYLTKPFSSTELIVRVQNLLRNYQQRLAIHQEAKDVEELQTTEELPSEKVAIKDQEWMAEIQATVLKNIKNAEYRLTDLAQAHFISERQLQRRLQKCTGLTFMEYIREARLQQARLLLEKNEESWPVKKLAAFVGFKTTKHFSKLFSNRFGKTVEGWRD